LTLQSPNGVWYRKVIFEFDINQYSPDRHSNYSSEEDENVQPFVRKGNERVDSKVSMEVDSVAGVEFFSTTSFSSGDEDDDEEDVEVKESTVSKPIMTITLTSDGGMEIHQFHPHQEGSRIPTASRIAQLRRLSNTIADIIACEEQGERDGIID
jgi:hypothetical protein